MKKLVSLLVVLVNLVGATSIFAYSDTDNSSYKSAIDELSQLGIINGFEDGTFRPDNNVTIIQLLKMAI